MAPSSSDLKTLDRSTISEVDTTDQLTDVLAIPEHLRDAQWKVESTNLGRWDSPSGLVVAGMGGSAVGGALARAILGDHCSRPILAARSYGLPAWTTPDTTVLCSSYSGDTEETLACYEAAGALGATRVVMTTGGELAEAARRDGVPVIPAAGGFQPRAAVAYATVAALEVAGPAAPAAHGLRDRRRGRAPRALVEEWGPEAPEDSLAKSIARQLNGTVPLIGGAGLTTPIAYRWKPDQRERQGPRVLHELPELDHNEIVGWTGVEGLGPFSQVFLDDSDTHPRTKARMRITEPADRRRRDGRLPCRVARPYAPSACSRSCCWAISSRCISRSCAASIPARRRPRRLKDELSAS